MNFSFQTSIFFFLNLSIAFAEIPDKDSTTVIRLNKAAYEFRLIDPSKTLKYSGEALQLAKNLNYINGIAEGFRIQGIGRYYQNRSDQAIESYLISLSYYKRAKNLAGQAKIYNNIGNLYKDIDYDKGLNYFGKALHIAEALGLKDLIAGVYLNTGNIYQNKKQYVQALENYNRSKQLFIASNNPIILTQCLQNIGGVYRSLNKLDQAEKYLKEAIGLARKHHLNYAISSANLVLTSVYISQKDFVKAQSTILEGKKYSNLINDYRLDYDYLYKSYQLEYKKQNYFDALIYLQQIYTKDSSAFVNNESVKIDLLQKQHKQLEQQRENELTIAEQKYSKTLFWASSIVAGLSLVVIFLLIRNVNKSAKTNRQLTSLNLEVSAQKENLNRINTDLENIIDERTKDLKIKNNKLSEYSSHLSHQIRSPISSLKGLMMLEKDKLIEHEELIMQLEKCIEDIDAKIININEMLNDPSRFTLKSSQE
ncbi:MAG: Tetratricopeptide repeat protein [Sphingobacteriales bacterium]|nr:Tetratricopeptide repeat protein [Sphingobacteriales bacterium]